MARLVLVVVVAALVAAQGGARAKIVVNDIIDVILPTALEELHVENMPAPDMYIPFTVPLWWIGRMTVKIKLTEGNPTSYRNLKRIGDVTLYRDGDKLMLEFMLGFEPFQVDYRHTTWTDQAQVSGYCTAWFSTNSVRVRASFLKGGHDCTLSLESVELSELGRVDFWANGFGPLNRFVKWGFVRDTIHDKMAESITKKLKEITGKRLHVACHDLFRR